MGERYVRSDDDRKTLYIEAYNPYGHSMSQMLPYDEIKIDENVNLESILSTPDDSDIGYFIEVDIKYPDKMNEKRKKLPICSCE